jgi:hypothetical protein
MPFEPSLEVERPLDSLLRLIRTSRLSTPRLAKEVGVSIQFNSRWLHRFTAERA